MNNFYHEHTEGCSVLLKKVLIMWMCIFLTGCGLQQETGVPESNSQEVSSEEAAERTEEAAELTEILPDLPEGWQYSSDEWASAKGDFNNDGIDDQIFVIQKSSDSISAAEATDHDTSDTSVPDRGIVVLKGTDRNKYEVAGIGLDVVLHEDEGGIWGDPFEKVTLESGRFIIDYYAGSNWRWYESYVFEWQESSWNLIQVTQGSYFNGDTLPEDADEMIYDLENGVVTHWSTDAEGNRNAERSNRPLKPLVTLEGFKIHDTIQQW
ncbi:hypothetical protein KHM83_14670 [Fusibacter paucivorans]|uniref:Lipoprotein n=1 Tax=Fusibacter paucivorans TaxID=76009 RepID=A0ABS5PTP5_9FIRM|nr:hypothetical protein [Fusibacter paucivorans]MBS7527926.1 hypothetical protein [Fusibacter paucivorans]